jgi:hypothetical protein
MSQTFFAPLKMVGKPPHSILVEDEVPTLPFMTIAMIKNYVKEH